MGRTVGIGIQDFEEVIQGNYFYIDKTHFIKEWWESGFGRYDVVIEPKNPAVIMEFKVRDEEDEKTLRDTANAALDQIDEKRYDTALLDKGVPADKIFKYGFAFEGKTVLIEKR